MQPYSVYRPNTGTSVCYSYEEYSSGTRRITLKFIRSFIHSAISIAPLQVIYYSEALPTIARILYRSFTPKRTGNCKGLAQVMAARAGVEPTTLRLKAIDST